MDRAIRILARGQMELLNDPSLTQADRALVMGQALAWSVIEDAPHRPIHPDTPGDWIETGETLGRVMEGTTSGVLLYGRAKGVFSDSELEREGVDLKALEKFRAFVLKTQGVDLAKARGKDMRSFFEMHEEIMELLTRVRQRWGESHPLIRSFEDHYFHGDLEEEQIKFLKQASATVKEFLYGKRH